MKDDEDALLLKAPRRPLWTGCLPLMLLPPIILGCCPCTGAFIFERRATDRMGEALGGVPGEVITMMALGTLTLFIIGFFVTIYMAELRWRDARVHDEGVQVGFVRYRWRDLRGFSCRAESVRLVVRLQPWTRWFGPVLWCEGETLADVVERLEQRGVRRVDG
jgi:hypothetical protein